MIYPQAVLYYLVGMNLKEAMQFAQKAKSQSRKILTDYFGQLKHIEKKEMAGLVSEADKESELAIIQELKPFGVEVVGEEGSFADKYEKLYETGRTRWLIDPLDGTTNYIHGFPIFCTSIALQVDGEVQLALIDVPMLNKTYTSIQGEGAFCNGAQMQVRSTVNIEDSLAATGFFAENEQALNKQLEIFSNLVKQCRGIRRAGAAAFDLCMVAEGVFDFFWEENLQPWDTAAGSLLVKEAGGQVTTYSGEQFYPEAKNIMASNGQVHASVLHELTYR